MLDKEAEMISKLEHPNIAKVMDHFVEDGRHYLVLQYINGPDLRQYVKENGAVPLAQALEWALKISEILKYLHSQEPPIIHRDLTPDNVVLYKNDLFLIDFGAANRFVGAATGTVVGKQSYIPPEQLRGKSVLQSDIYALGGSLYYLLTAADPLPLAEASPQSKIADLPKRVDDLVRKCTAFEPEDRFQTADDLITELRECIIAFSNENATSIKIN
jgi:serine/threonine-protein kinase